MTREAFAAIFERQCASGLTIKEFCMNEGYSSSSFYFWKRKFCSSGSESFPARSKGHTEDFAPVRFPVQQRPHTTSVSGDLQGSLNEIVIELPSGVKIHFRGACESESAMRLITQIYNSHVLPQ